jgi:hypothetical protein
MWVSEGEEREQKDCAAKDWDTDRRGHRHLNFARFTSCWFTVADRFTDTISAGDYAAFLRAMATDMALARRCKVAQLEDETEAATAVQVP